MQNRKHTSQAIQAAAIAAVVGFAMAGTAQAADYWWNVVGNNTTAYNWSDTSSWASAVTGTAASTTPGTVAGDTIRFPSNTAAAQALYQVNMDTDWSVGGIVSSNKGSFAFLRGTAASAPTLTIGAGGINHNVGYGSGGNQVTRPRFGNSVATSVDVVLGATQTWTNNVGNTSMAGITVYGTVSGTAADGGTQTLTLNGANNAATLFEFNGLVQDRVGSGSGKLGFVIAPTGTNTDMRYGMVAFRNKTNTFGGGISVGSGTTAAAGITTGVYNDQISNWTGTGTPFGTGDITISAGATMTLAFHNAAIRTVNSGTIYLGSKGWGTGVRGGIRGGALQNENTTLTADITLTADACIAPGGGGRADVADVLQLSGKVTGDFNLDVGDSGSTAGGGVLTLHNTANAWKNTAIKDISVLRVGASEVIPDGSVISFEQANSRLDIYGKTETIGGLSSAADLGYVQNHLTATAATLKVAVAEATSATFGGIIRDAASGTGTVAFTKSGLGTQILTGANIYTGATAINDGQLLVGVGGVGSLGNTAVGVNAGGTLGGNGTIGGIVTIEGGTLSPGNSVGMITVGGLVMNDVSDKLSIEFDGATNDTIKVTGALNITGGDLQLVSLNSTVIPSSFVLFDVTGATVTNLSGLTVNGQAAQFTTTDGLITVMVPEPTTIGLLALVSLGAIARRRRA